MPNFATTATTAASRGAAGRATIRVALVASLVCWLTACVSPQDQTGDALTRAAEVMGSTRLKTLRYVGEGTGYTFGQAYQPGGAWPKITLHSMIRTIDFDSTSMRDEIVLSRAEPQGGGGYPMSGQQRNDQFVSGDLAWNQTGTTATPNPISVSDRLHQLWITPHGVLKAAQRNGATSYPSGGGGSVISFTQPGDLQATITIGADGLVKQVDSSFPHPVLGDTRAVTVYSDYRDVDGIKFPMHVRQSMGGFPVLDLDIKEVQANVGVAIPIPEAARNQDQRVTTEKLADGVWFVGGGSHNSVAIEMTDHLVLVETPLDDARSKAVIESVRQLAPGKPIRFVVNSHQHFDHSGGVRLAVTEGATIVTQAANVPYFERVFAQPNTIRPDRMANSGKRLRLTSVDDKLELGDASRRIEIHRIAGSVHSKSLLMVYLPKDKLLIEADAYTPGAPNSPPPTTPNPNHLNLIDNIERLNLAVDRIAPLHGRVVALSELYAVAGRATR